MESATGICWYLLAGHFIQDKKKKSAKDYVLFTQFFPMGTS